MKRTTIFVAQFFVFSLYLLSVYSQTASSANDPFRLEREREERGRRVETDLEKRISNLRALEELLRDADIKDRQTPQAPELDKDAKKRVALMRRINVLDAKKYATFLANKRTGIFKLFPNFDCVTPNLIRIGGDCENFVPISSDFSFRYGEYIERNYHDIGFEKNELISNGFFSQGIMVSLGDVPIEGITIESTGIRFLREFRPDSTPKEAGTTARNFDKGVDFEGLKYTSKVEPQENSTYALRVIAYSVGNSLAPPTANSTLPELKFLTLRADKRDDLIVVFRIVRKDPDGGITIVRKELDRRKAPSLKFEKGEIMSDFKNETK